MVMLFFKHFFRHIFFSIILAVTACTLSTDDLAKEVQASIEDKFQSKQFQGKHIIIKSFMLTHKSGNEYKGILETMEPNGEYTYAVEVIYDGEAFSWEIKK